MGALVQGTLSLLPVVQRRHHQHTATTLLTAAFSAASTSRCRRSCSAIHLLRSLSRRRFSVWIAGAAHHNIKRD